MAAYRVDPAALLSVADRMTAYEQHLEQVLAHLESVEHQLGNDWDGAGGLAQSAAQQRWREGAAEMRTALADLRNAAEKAHANYHGAAQANLRNWS